jgi:hypothetical protein
VVQNLVPDHLHHLKGLQRRDAVDQHIPVNADKVLRVQDAVLVLPGRVDNLGRKLLALVADLLAKGVLDGRVVALDKVPVDIADCQRGLACLFQTRIAWLVRGSLSREGRGDEPTERLPTMAIFRCLASVVGIVTILLSRR